MWHLKSSGLEECVPVEEMGIETALISFPVAVSKYSDKKNLRGEEFILAQGSSHTPS